MPCKAFLAAIVLLPLAAAVLPAELDEAFAKAAAYKAGESRQWILAVEKRVRECGGKDAERKATEQRLLGLLGNAQATKDAKAFACEQLSLIGAAAAVPSLAALLADESLHHPARMALERIQDEAAGAALRDALGKLQGKLLVGVIHSLGERRDAQAAAALGKLTGGEPDTAQAALWALGRIGGPEAAKALASAEKSVPAAATGVWVDACVSSADGLLQAGRKDEAVCLYKLAAAPARPAHVRLAALRGLAAAAPEEGTARIIEALKGDDARLRNMAAALVAGIPGEAATKSFAAELQALPPAVQVILLGAFAARGDRGALPAVTAALKSAESSVRLAAMQSLAQLGGAAAVPALVERITQGDKEEQKAARECLVSLRGEGVEQAMAAQLESPAPAVRVEIIKALAAQRTPAALAAALKAAGDKDESVRCAALDALGTLAGEGEVKALVGLLTGAAGDAERSRAEAALCATLARLPNAEAAAAPVSEAFGNAALPLRGPLLRALAATRGKKALQTIREALKDERAEVQDAAVRTLCDWPDASPAADVLAVAQNSQHPAHRILALRGYCRMAGLEELPAAERLAMCERALGLATRVEEKRLALGAVTSVSSLEALRFAEKHLEDADLKTEAAAACVKLAAALQKKHAAEAQAVLQKVLKVLPEGKATERVRQDAKKALSGKAAPEAPRGPADTQ